MDEQSPANPQSERGAMDSSPSAATGDRSGKQLPDPVGNQAAEVSGKGPPNPQLGRGSMDSSPSVQAALGDRSGKQLPDPVGNQAVVELGKGPPYPQLGRGSMDSSPSVQAAPGDRSGKQLRPDPVGNQSAEVSGKGVPSYPAGKHAPKQDSGNAKPDPVKQAPPVRTAVKHIRVAARLNTGAKLVYGKGLPVYGLGDAGQRLGSMEMLPVVTDKVVVQGITSRATLVGAPIRQGERPLARISSISETIDSTETYVRVKLGPILREKNANFMFLDGQFYVKKNGYLYYKYASLSEAHAACHRVNKGRSYDITVGVDPNCETSEKENCEEEPPGRAKKKKKHCDVDEMKAKEAAAEKSKTVACPMSRITMDVSLYRWQRIKDFCSIEGNEVAARFKFDVAERFGSICSSVSMVCTTDVGTMVFPGVVAYMAQGFEKKLSWGGNIGLDSIVIAANGTCAIVPIPTEDATDSNITKDLTKVVYDLAELYRVDGNLPPYFDDLFSFLKDIPAGIADDVALLRQTMLQAINHASCLPDQKIIALLQEFFVFFKNLEEPAKTKFNEEAAQACDSNWQDLAEIDCLLNGILKESKKLQATVGDEAAYVRHVGVHVTDQMFKIWLQIQQTLEAYVASSKSEVEGGTVPLPCFVLKERLMFIAYYFENFIPKFFRALFGSMTILPWVNDLCQPFLRKKEEIAAAPFGSVDVQKVS